MAQIRRNRRLIEHIDPVTGARTYTDELTGEIVAQDQVVAQPTIVEQTTIVTEPTVTAVTETVVTERVQPGPTYVVNQPAVPVAPVAPGTVSEVASEVYTDDPYEHRRARAVKIQQVIYLVFGILEGLLAIRFVLSLLAANPASGFGALIYGITAPFMWPFAGLFGQPSVGGSVIEWNALVAIVVYALIAWVLAKIAWLIAGDERSGVRTSRVNTRVDR